MRGVSPGRGTCKRQEGSEILQERRESLERHVRESQGFRMQGVLGQN